MGSLAQSCRCRFVVDGQLAQDKFAEIAEAYEILSNKSSRELYDRARGLRAAKQRRAAERMHKESSVKTEGAGGFEGEGSGAAQWYHPYADGMGEADDFFGYGTSFAETAGGAAAFAAFGSGPFFAGGGGAYEFHPQDPIELFDVRAANLCATRFDDIVVAGHCHSSCRHLVMLTAWR